MWYLNVSCNFYELCRSSTGLNFLVVLLIFAVYFIRGITPVFVNIFFANYWFGFLFGLTAHDCINLKLEKSNC